MQYRDNVLEIKPSRPYDPRLISATYIIHEFSIRTGQDPERRIHAGLHVNAGRDGKLKFSVGRKSSEAVARWFSQRISTSENTFGSNPKELNFAFMGELRLNIETIGFINFYNVAFAQGHTLNSNNWWFGAKGATKAKVADPNWLWLAGRTQPNNEEKKLVFRRGGAGLEGPATANNVTYTTGFMKMNIGGGLVTGPVKGP
jgi:hypothetical protein